ncbi:MAG TPA: DUF3108 domain-containing protein [Candidatus Acidoferrum sp.]|nr:DUF3108 domain-containing protein [Candidatus Acidoferrum sp.]
MSKLIAATVLVGALAGGAGAYYWMHGFNVSDQVSKAPPSTSFARSSADPRRAETVSAASPSKESAAAEHAAPADATPPLHAGEVLEFSADVSKLSNVANLRLQTLARHNFFGKSAWHLQAFAHTENPLRMVFELDDQFDSYSDAATLSSLQYEMHLNERGQKQDSIQRMETSDAVNGASGETETRVLPGTRDPLGLMQYLRTVDWSKAREIHGPVYDGHKLYDVSAKMDGPAQNITVPAGSFNVSKIDIRVFDAGAEVNDAHFALYLANNASRTPVLLEAVMPFATARVALVKVK